MDDGNKKRRYQFINNVTDDKPGLEVARSLFQRNYRKNRRMDGKSVPNFKL